MIKFAVVMYLFECLLFILQLLKIETRDTQKMRIDTPVMFTKLNSARKIHLRSTIFMYSSNSVHENLYLSINPIVDCCLDTTRQIFSTYRKVFPSQK